MGQIEVGNRLIAITNPDRVLFGKSGITKGELIEYYRKIAPIMLPLIKDHPLTMQRFPDGIEGEGFYQKDVSSYFPAWIKTKAVAKKDDGQVHYVVANSQATLVYLANQACIVMHAWPSRIDKLHYPDRLIFDLDPSVENFSLVRKAALELKDILEDVGVTCFVMTTGSKGLHVVAPLIRKYTNDSIVTWAQEIAKKMIARHPDRYTLELRKEKRGDRIFIDTLRNSWSATSVAPYSVRAREGAPIATPIYWKDVASQSLRSDTYTIKNIEKYFRKGNPWHDFLKVQNKLSEW